jgi:hypothetical protein
MFRIPTDTIRSAVVARTIGSKEKLTLDDVLSSRIPTGIRSYLHAELASKFGESLQNASQEFEFGEEAYRFDRNEFLSVIDRALEFHSRYLPSPREVLPEFVYGTSNDVTLPVIQERLSHISDYRYLRVLLLRAIATKPGASITRSWFTKLLSSIDDAVVQSYTPDQIAKLSDPIFHFCLFGQADTSGDHPA